MVLLKGFLRGSLGVLYKFLKGSSSAPEVFLEGFLRGSLCGP